MKILKISNNAPLVLGDAVEVLKNGGVVVLPTDTVYGLAADAGNEKAVKKVFEIKGRAEDKKLPVFVSSFEMSDEIAYVKNEKVLNFLKKVWPGKITCVFPANRLGLRGYFDEEGSFSEGGPTQQGDTFAYEGVTLLTVGVRMPNHELVLSIIEKFGGPITGTSANVSGGKEHTKIDELIAEFQGLKAKPDLILDAGDIPPSKPSTVLDCTIWPPKILREGAVSKEELEKILG